MLLFINQSRNVPDDSFRKIYRRNCAVVRAVNKLYIVRRKKSEDKREARCTDDLISHALTVMCRYFIPHVVLTTL